jgi:crotonobetainyl-CoA:carnitine CoA-transferase CaiB-like acyl-CoA transferase
MVSAAPLLGQHTTDVLTGLLGYSLDEVKKLSAEDVLT